MKSWTWAVIGAGAMALASGTSCAEEPAQSSGTVVLDGVAVPLSDLMSPQARAYVRDLIVRHPFAGGAAAADDIKGYRAHQDDIMRGFLGPMRARYKVLVTDDTLAGVPVQVVTPADGIAPENRHRVLINLHGGGFVSGARTASLVESVPLAALMRIKVISIDYRMAPEYRFPAASEDVARVYERLLKVYDASRIALYGCSAGGMLTAESMAWFQSHGLPRPAAAGVFCAPLGKLVQGDSGYLARPLTFGVAAASPRSDGERAIAGYLDNVADDDPLAYPVVSQSVLAKFPPTLFISGTRSMEFSAVLNSHNALNRAGVDTSFFGWDGMFHGFFYNSELPESREAYRIMVEFFEKHLAR